MAFAQPLANQAATLREWEEAAGEARSFDVASVRQNKPGADVIQPTFMLSADDYYTPNGGLFAADFPLSVYIQFAYKLWLTREQVQTMLAHLPKWVTTDYFEVHARAAGTPTKDQMRLMVRSLLEERFKLAVHFEPHEVPVLALTTIKPGLTGARLRPHSEGVPCDVVKPPETRGPGGEPMMEFPPMCDSFVTMQPTGRSRLMGARNTTLDLIAESLSMGGMGRPVVNRTGLQGRYDFVIEWTPDTAGAGGGGMDAAREGEPPSFEEALREQLGLKVTPARAMLDLLVVDHIERPTEN